MKDVVKILVVDDELGIRDLLSSELRSHDFHVVTASNGQEAVDRVSAHSVGQARRRESDLMGQGGGR